ncbi:MAG: asparaginase [Bacteroidetes bacterium]|nr:asparaginase [Bacteroidota bacterium]MCZ2132500.1 asparaginase [Bacteroidota bacterium]
MNRQKPLVTAIFTGGTIAMKPDAGSGGVVPKLSAAEILNSVPDLENIARVETVEFGRYPSPHITPEIMLQLSRLAQYHAERPEVAGIIVTHGTDTLEETAFFLDCTLKTSKPVVVVGAMRNSAEADWDGPRNLRDAVIIASRHEAQDYGTLICLSDVINAASEATKTDATDINTFASMNFGPVGRISNSSLFLYRKPVHRDHFDVKELPAFVPLFKCYAGMEGGLVKLCRENGAAGFVIEGFGAGNVPPPVFYDLVECVKQGLPVVLVSRCPVGRIEHTYAYEGAGKQLYEAGVIFADYMNGQKARIKLMCALGAGYGIEEIRRAFEWASLQENDKF